MEFHGEGFEAAGNFRNLDLAVFLAATGSRSEELEIIDDQDIDAVLFFDPACASSELTDRKQAGLVQEQGQIGDFSGNATESGDLAFVKLAAANLF